MTRETTHHSALHLVSDVFSDATTLVSTEAKLMRAELNEKINQAVAAIGMMVIAAVFFIGALFLLLQTGVALLVQMGLSTTIASIIMAVVSGVIGYLLYLGGKKALSPAHLTPQRSINQINRDVEMARDATSRR